MSNEKIEKNFLEHGRTFYTIEEMEKDMKGQGRKASNKNFGKNAARSHKFNSATVPRGGRRL